MRTIAVIMHGNEGSRLAMQNTLNHASNSKTAIDKKKISMRAFIPLPNLLMVGWP
jgi:hypothetical protein